MKTINLTVRITEYEKKQLLQEADRRGMSMSDIVRSWIAKLPEPSNN
jgi:hypothetical protein